MTKRDFTYCLIIICLVATIGIVVADLNALKRDVAHINRTPTINIEHGYVYPREGDLIIEGK